MKHAFASALAALSLAMGLSGPAAAAPEQPDVTIAVGGRVALYYLPLNIADLNGYFAEEGLNVEIVDFQGGSKSVAAVVGGSADILSSAFEHLIVLEAKKQPMTGFALMGRFPGFVLSVTPDLAESWDGMKTLKGRNVGVTSPGSSTNKMVDLLMKTDGLDPAEVSIIGIGAGPGVLAAYQNGSVVASVEADPAVTLLEKEKLAVPVVDTRTLEGATAVYGGPMPAATLSTTRAFAEKNPETVQALANAMVKALKFIQDSSPEEIAAVLPDNMKIGGDTALYAKMIAAGKAAYSPDGVISKDAAATAYKALLSYNPLVAEAGELDIDAVYDNRFVEAAGAE